MKISVSMLTILILVSLSCSIGKKGVFFKEMWKKPTIEILDNKIVVKTGNSLDNSALLIYKIEKTIDKDKKTIELKGYQAIGKKYKESFEIQLKNTPSQELKKYEFFGVDPDGKKNTISFDK
jgi:hypothetical protein